MEAKVFCNFHLTTVHAVCTHHESNIWFIAGQFNRTSFGQRNPIPTMSDSHKPLQTFVGTYVYCLQEFN